jgi:hypothetical protein
MARSKLRCHGRARPAAASTSVPDDPFPLAALPCDVLTLLASWSAPSGIGAASKAMRVAFLAMDEGQRERFCRLHYERPKDPYATARHMARALEDGQRDVAVWIRDALRSWPAPHARGVMHAAISCGNVGLVRHILDGQPCSDKPEALRLAAHMGQLELFKVVLRSDPSSIPRDLLGALREASRKDHKDIVVQILCTARVFRSTDLKASLNDALEGGHRLIAGWLFTVGWMNDIRGLAHGVVDFDGLGDDFWRDLEDGLGDDFWGGLEDDLGDDFWGGLEDGLGDDFWGDL